MDYYIRCFSVNILQFIYLFIFLTDFNPILDLLALYGFFSFFAAVFQ